MDTFIETTDIYFAAALLSLDMVYVGADKTNPKQQIFRFELPEDVDNPDYFDFLETGWANNTLIVKAVKYAEALQRLKTVVHNK